MLSLLPYYFEMWVLFKWSDAILSWHESIKGRTNLLVNIRLFDNKNSNLLFKNCPTMFWFCNSCQWWLLRLMFVTRWEIRPTRREVVIGNGGEASGTPKPLVAPVEFAYVTQSIRKKRFLEILHPRRIVSARFAHRQWPYPLCMIIPIYYIKFLEHSCSPAHFYFFQWREFAFTPWSLLWYRFFTRIVENGWSWTLSKIVIRNRNTNWEHNDLKNKYGQRFYDPHHTIAPNHESCCL